MGYFAGEEDCAKTVKKTYENENRLIDTHTAVAVSSAEQYMNENEAKAKMLIVSTASPYKFAGDVLLSLTGSKPQNDLEALGMLNSYSGVEIPTPLQNTLSKTPIFKDVINKEEMAETVVNFALS